MHDDSLDVITAREKAAFIATLRLFNNLVDGYHNKNDLKAWFGEELGEARRIFYDNDIILHHIHHIVGDGPWRKIAYELHLSQVSPPWCGKWCYLQAHSDGIDGSL